MAGGGESLRDTAHLKQGLQFIFRYETIIAQVWYGQCSQLSAVWF